VLKSEPREPANPARAAEELVLLAPLDGWAAPLAEVPDPVFSDRMMGDGVAIDPTGAVLRAPCDGKILLLHQSRHAVTLRAANGAEILMHVGLDTVALGGRFFTVHVAIGQTVKAGDRLISFDLDQLGEQARSLITPILVTNGEDFLVTRRVENESVTCGQELMRIRPLAGRAAAARIEGQEVRRGLVVVSAHGIHARPAARLAELAKSFTAEIVITFGDKQANAKSPVALMGLGLSKGAEVIAIARGTDAEQALAGLAALMESGLGEVESAYADATVAVLTAPAEAGAIVGVRAAPGIGLGMAVRLRAPEILVKERGQGPDLESKLLQGALAAVRTKIQAAIDKGGAGAPILAAHLGFLEDPELADTAERAIRTGQSAGQAWRAAIREQIAILQELDDPRFRERVSDLIDIERQVLIALGGAQAAPAAELPEQAILLAEDLLPSELAGLDTARICGIVMAAGGPTSHAAILAAGMDIPALVACGPSVLEIADGATLLLDADRGRLVVAPSDAEQEEIRRHLAARQERKAAARATMHALCHTKDGVRIEIDANLGSISDAKVAVAAGAEGCGLLRTEFLFLDRETPPNETEQIGVYRAIAQAFGERPLTVRTLDIGGDKPASYLPIPAEENPALGLRGVRVSLWRPELLKTQLRAILKAIPPAQCRIMTPMIASLAELRRVRAILDEVRAELGKAEPVQLGIMVETPAAAMTADILAAETDFFSVGTNDLTQYGLAMDRGNPILAASFDALHPAVLRLIAATIEGANRHDRPVGVCGGLASDVEAAPLLVGLGVRSLSAATGQIADLKAAIGKVTIEQCRRLARKALAAGSAEEVRGFIRSMGED
jgi:phosphoenolpyruvate-protein phosphotransferase